MRWGILGCGDIAAKTVQAGQRLPEVRFVAAASRSAEKAQAFAQQHGIDRAHGSYDTLLADPGLEGVWRASSEGCHTTPRGRCFSQSVSAPIAWGALHASPNSRG